MFHICIHMHILTNTHIRIPARIDFYIHICIFSCMHALSIQRDRKSAREREREREKIKHKKQKETKKRGRERESERGRCMLYENTYVVFSALAGNDPGDSNVDLQGLRQ